MVHPITAELYRKNNYEYVWTTQDYVEENFRRLTEKNKEPARYRIDQIYRIKHGGQDYLVYDQTTISQDMFGNEITLSQRIGMHEEPTFTKRYDDSIKGTVTTGVSGSRTVYDIPATAKNIEDILAKQTEQHDTNFVLVNSNQKYAGFSSDEFKNTHYDDLLTKATTGNYPEKLKPFGLEDKVPESSYPYLEAQKGRQQQRQQQQQKKSDPQAEKYMKELKKGLVAETEKGSKEEKEYEKMQNRLAGVDTIDTISSNQDEDKPAAAASEEEEEEKEEEEQEQQSQSQPEYKDQQQSKKSFKKSSRRKNVS